MKSALALIGAGTAFAGTVVAGLLLGLWIDTATHAHFWVVVLLFAGLLLGGYAAYRLIASALSV